MAKKFVEYTGDVVTDEKDPFAKGDSGFALGTTEQLNKDIGDDWWKLPLGVALGGAAVAFGKPALEKLKGSEAAPIDRTRDIPMGGPGQPVVPPVQQSRTLAEAQEMASKALAGRVMNPPAPPAGAVAPQTPVKAPTLTEAVATGQSPTKAIQAEVAPMVDQAAPVEKAAVAPKTRAPKVQETFKSLADIPLGTTFRPDIGNLDRALYNIVGAEHRRNAMELLNQGKPFGQVPDTNKAVSPIISEYWKTLQSQIPETILSRPEREKLGVKTDFGNYGGLGRKAKVGGVIGTLLTAAEAANATQQAQQGNTAPAKEMGFDLGTGGLMAALLGLPASALAALGLGSKELSSGTLNSPEARALGIAPPR